MKTLDQLKVLVVGDIMLDKYVCGNVNRISPEAPVPIINVTDEYYTLGGCGNVVRNIKELGCNVHCVASIGIDKDGVRIESELKRLGVRSLLVHGSRRTTVKERIIADQRQIQMLRLDREYVDLINHNLVTEMMKTACKDDYDIVIVSDYAKGLISHELMVYLKYQQNADIIVDPKPKNANLYNGVFMITPNENEWKEIKAFPHNISKVNYILETRGHKGMRLFENHRNIEHEIFADEALVYNVSGAGDTVIAIMGVCLAMNMDPLTAAKISNKCAGYVVTQPGTTPVPKDIFLKYFSEQYLK